MENFVSSVNTHHNPKIKKSKSFKQPQQGGGQVTRTGQTPVRPGGARVSTPGK